MPKNDSIRLHPVHGVNPTIAQYQCPATGKIWESGELILLGYNKNKKADMYTVVGARFCPEVQEKLDQGYVVLVGVDEDKTTDKECPYRTGEVIYLKRERVAQLFNSEVKDMAYVDKQLTKALIELHKRSESNDEK